jgi:protein-S-isoprenylcysteine O-methyltransferase Ste14
MKLLGYVFAGIIILALIQWIFAAPSKALLILLVWSAITHPIEFAAWLAFGLAVALVQVHPLASIAVCVIGYTVHRIVKARKRGPILRLPPPYSPPPE